SSDSTFVAISGYPRFMEGARYWLQTAGFSEKVYSETKNKDDYRDDYMSRGLWVNALAGGSSRNPFQDGYNIPIDVAFALHSDAGFSQTDTITGTLGIYRVLSDGKQRYIYGGKRDIARSMTDVIQSQVVNDIRHKIAPEWTRREIWDRSYLEARLAEVPTVLLELLSHQNIADMRYGLDPDFKFIVSRAIYKGILKFIAGINGQPYVVQPLPVNSFAIDADFALNNVVNLKWRPTLDSLESSAKPSSYIVYTRVTDLDKYEDNISAIGSGIFGFDEGIVVSDTTFSLSLQPGKLYSFKVTAVNQGGESFPSEILSAGIVDGRTKSTKSVMVVNNYTRVAPAAYFGIQDSLKSGFLYQLDSGSPYLRDFSFTGNQTDFDRKSEFINNDDPGFGGSASDYETMVIAGNSFDFPAKHGAAIMRAGYNFVSSSMQAVADGGVKLKKYAVVDLICGKQIKTPKGNGRIAYPVFPSNLQTVLADYLSGGKALLVSGAYVGTDSHENIYDLKFDDSYFKKVLKPEQLFAEEILHFRWVANLRGSDGIVDVQNNRLEFNQNTFDFKTSPNSDSYSVESPDVISPVGFRASSIMKYRQTGTSAGVLYKGLSYKTVTLGFPLEALSSQSQIDRLTADLLRILTE
ncbi:MAG: xanthan lyase, partial [Bacteroidales bacterium]|nr:xanthan lyase [Bacteroidales bacterium]